MRARPVLMLLAGLALSGVAAGTARAEEGAARDIASAVDAYLPPTAGRGEAPVERLMGGPGSAGYEEGFWIRGGAFGLRMNVTLQARYEAWVWHHDEEPLDPFFAGGNLSGFALPRATLELAGTAPCSTSWYLELELGEPGRDGIDRRFGGGPTPSLGALGQTWAYETLREAWIQWSPSDLMNVRMGRIRTATTRQLMTPPKLQQFADVSLASAFVGSLMPGYTDRNRDHGLMLHGAIGADGGLSYLLTVTNGDGGDGVRNVQDGRTSDNLAFSGRVNYAFEDPIGYQEGALRQDTCGTWGEVGAWAWYYADRADRPHRRTADALRVGVDVAYGWSGLSFTGAATYGHDEAGGDGEATYWAFLAQLGWHFPGTPWEVAARWSRYDVDRGAPPLMPQAGQQQPLGDGAVQEWALAVNYYLNGHGNKMTLDLAFVQGLDAASALVFDPYTGYQGAAGATGAGDDDLGFLLRFQWQLSL